jgi:hypothetical protein
LKPAEIFFGLLAFRAFNKTEGCKMAITLQFLAEQHLAAAKLVRENGARLSAAQRELFIRKSNSFVACVRLSAKERGGICLDKFDWWSVTPDWNVIEDQVRLLAPPYIDGPPLVPDLR